MVMDIGIQSPHAIFLVSKPRKVPNLKKCPKVLFSTPGLVVIIMSDTIGSSAIVCEPLKVIFRSDTVARQRGRTGPR